MQQGRHRQILNRLIGRELLAIVWMDATADFEKFHG
jgi:hypothetical protein